MTKRQTMKSRTSRWAIRTTVMAASLAAATSTTSAIDPAFTYQGQLKQNGAPVTGLADFRFYLWDAETGGTELADITLNGVSLDNGLFTVQLAFDMALFDGSPRYLEIQVAYPSPGLLAPLAGRQPITPAPYALHALNGGAGDGHSLDAVDGSPTDAVYVEANGRVRMNKGGLNIFDDAGHGISMASDSFVFNEGTSEDPVYGYSSAADTHTFYTNGSRQMVISNAGNVGIGMLWNQDPAAKLHIGGTPGVDGIEFPDGTLQTTAAIGGGGDLWTPSGSDVYYDDGNVGVGTSTPGHALHVTTSGERAIFGDNSATSGAAYGVYGESDSTSGRGLAGVATSSSGTTYGVFGRNYSSAGAALFGNASGSSGSASGVFGQSYGSTGRGVTGMARSTSGVNYGVYGRTDSSDGYAGYFTGGKNYFQGNVGIGTPSPGYKLHVTTSSTTAVMGQSSSLSGYGGHFVNTSADGTALYAESAGAGASDATLRVHNSQPNAGMAAYLTSVGSYATMHAENDGTGEVLWLSRDNSDGEFIVAHNEHTGGRVFSVDHDGWTKATMLEITGEEGVDGVMFADGTVQTTAAVGGGGDSLWSGSGGDIFYTAGNVGIGTSSPTEKLHVAGDAQIDDYLGIGIAPVHSMKLRISSDSVWGLMSQNTAAGGQAIWGEATATTGGTTGVYGKAAAPGGIGVWGEHSATSGDEPGVYGRTSSTANLAPGVKGEALSAASGAFTVGVMGLSHAGLSVGVYGKADHTNTTIPTQGGYFESTSSTGIGVHGVASGAGAYAGYFDGRGYFTGDLEVAATARVDVLQIDGGADLSENFAIAGSTKPGMVVVIDSNRPGALCTSTSAYDRRVAGIISGAGGVRTGMLMSQVGSVADGEHPVALTGRVYCWCDASGGAIEPGDMLTTSSKPGHAMKVSDYARAQGAIIGKAMTSLSEDSGLVLVLVNLQ